MFDTAIVLQMCESGMTFADYLHQFDFVPAVVCSYSNRLTLPLLAMMVYAGVAVPIYLRTDSILIPFVLLLLTGGATVGQMAGPAAGLAAVVLLLVGSGTFTYLYYEYSR